MSETPISPPQIRRPKRGAGENNDGHFLVRMPPETLSELDKLCARHNISRNLVVIQMIEEAIKNFVSDEPILIRVPSELLLSMNDMANMKDLSRNDLIVEAVGEAVRHFQMFRSLYIDTPQTQDEVNSLIKVKE